ncbi:hypothetical protein P171DRAFT_465325 [Karstenula rhodostoma CBS 690.94]|uniref:Pre-rRNA processing protein n=1 Tax=Karstenula rhodostoma CBS 690.94 TaxID=1392251 RepID=A0A9P4U7U0_9PLEO|nr:hypothetical protein P171DRAFT_465325 [Karstenula rhodostoma CBS 690.94]
MDTPDYGTAWGDSTRASSRPASHKSGSSHTARSHTDRDPDEVSPLLASPEGDESEHEDDDDEHATATTSLLQSLSGGSTSGKDDKTPFWKKRWPSIVALVVLFIAVALIMLGFLATEGIEEYALQAADFKPTKLSLDSLTDTGVRVQVEGDFSMDASKVQKKSVRNLGRLGTWIAREVETGATEVDVYLPEYDMVRVGTARVPGIKVNIRNGHTTHVSFFAHLEPGRFDNLRNVANDWMDGRLGQIRLKGKADIPLRSGLIRLGSQTISESFTFQGDKLPSVPRYNITKLNLREQRPGRKGMGADVSIMVTNDFPVQLTIPPVAVDVLVDGCLESDRHIMVGTAETAQLQVEPKHDVEVNVTGRVETLSQALTETCPGSSKSPLDALLGNYMHGQEAKLYVNCCNFPDPDTPAWAHDLLKDITVPVPLPGHEMGKLIKNFSLADVHFHLPDPFAEPGTPEAAPKISAVVKVDINIPNEMNFPLDVNRVKADADIFYHGKLLGTLDLKKWQDANSTRIDAHGSDGPSLLVQSDIQKAPINIKDDDLFSEVVQELIFGSKGVLMKVKAAVSVKVDTPIGGFAVREIPAEGVVPVKPIGHGNGNGGGGAHNTSALAPKIGNLSIINTSRTSITLQANVNITNPTNYSATVPYFNINILVNKTVVGQAVAKDIYVHPGNNTNLPVTAVWDPYTHSGAKGKEIGRQLLSQYISGYNVSLTLQAHNGTIPSQPALGAVLAQFPITLAAPHLSTPKDPDQLPPDEGDPPDDGKTHFIRSATMHLITSTALFTLASPFSSTTMYITTLNATAFYDGHPSGKILYELPFAVPPGLSETPRLPVDWSIGSVGYDAIRKALGGTLRLSAFADVGIRIGAWKETVWYKGGSIGASVRL